MLDELLEEVNKWHKDMDNTTLTTEQRLRANRRYWHFNSLATNLKVQQSHVKTQNIWRCEHARKLGKRDDFTEKSTRGVQGAAEQLVAQMTLESINHDMLPASEKKKLVLMDRLKRKFNTTYSEISTQSHILDFRKPLNQIILDNASKAGHGTPSQYFR